MGDWEQRYRDGDTPWEKGAPAPPLRAWLSQNQMSGRVLVPGCGIGDDVRLIAASPTVSVIGLDIADSAVERARERPPVGSEIYQLGDIRQPAPELQQRFDWVFEHTCFCALTPGDRAAYLSGVREVLVPGGKVFAIFYPLTGNPPGEGPPYSIEPGELDRLLEIDFEILKSWVPAVGYPGRVGNEACRILRKR